MKTPYWLKRDAVKYAHSLNFNGSSVVSETYITAFIKGYESNNKTKYQENDVIITTKEIQGIPKDSVGVVVFCYDTLLNVYEVEFNINDTKHILVIMSDEFKLFKL